MKIEKKVKQVETLMRSLKLSIHWGHNGLELYHNGQPHQIIDTEDGLEVSDFPRVVKTEKITKN